MSNFEDPPKPTPASLGSATEATAISGKISSWQMIDRLFRQRPGLMGTGCLFVIAGMSTLFGLSVQCAWVSLMIGIVLWFFTLHWLKWFRRTAGNEGGVKERKKVFDDYVGCLSVLIIFSVGSWILGRPLFPLGRHGASKLDPSLQAIADRTEAYWEVAVAQLHQVRFGIPPISGETSAAYHQRQLLLLTECPGRVKRATTELVDPELVALVKRLSAVDKMMLHFVERLNALNPGERFAPSQVSAEQDLSETIAFLESITEKQIAELPPEKQQLFAVIVEIDEIRLELLGEIELMQVRLQARYKGWNFLLPVIYEAR